MQAMSSNAQVMLRSGVPIGVTISATGASGSITITEADMVSNTFYIDRNSVSGQSIEIGNVEASELGFVLDNSNHRFDTYIFEGSELTVDLHIDSDTIRAGVFTVDQPPQGVDMITITALDHMVRFDRVYSTSLAGKQTLATILQDCCTTCGVTLGTTDFANDDYQGIVPSVSGLTCRQVISWIAQLAGSNAWIDHNGALQISWYGENQGSVEIPIEPDDRFSYELAENDVVLSGLVYRTPDVDYLWGTDEYAIVIENNGLIDPDNYDAVMTSVYNKLSGFFYRPFRFDVRAYPHVWPMDVVQIESVSGSVIPSIVTNNRIMLSDGNRISGLGYTSTVIGYAETSPFTAQQQTIIQKTARDVMAVWGIDAGWIKTGILDAARIGAGTISADKLSTDSLSTDQAFADALTANDGLITNLYSHAALINGLSVNMADVIELDASRIRSGYLSADRIEAASIIGGKLVIGAITSRELATDAVTADKIKAGEVTAVKLSVNSVETDKIKANAVTSEKINALAVTAEKIAANAVTADKVDVIDLTADTSFITSLDARYATISSLTVDMSFISDLFVNKQLAAYIDVGSLDAGVINTTTINSVLANSIAGTIDTAFITDALISSLSADKLITGSIKTNQISILSGTSESDSRLRILNENLVINDGVFDRIVVGKYDIGSGNRYGILVRGSDGTTVLMDENGVTNAGIIDGAVTDIKVASDANIAGSKLDIESVISSFNGATAQLNASKVQLDTEAQTLEIAFNSLKTTVTDQGTTLSSHGTSISTIEGQISSKIWQSDIDAAVADLDVGITKSETAPDSPSADELWLDISVVPNVLKRWDGSDWVKATPTDASEVGAFSSDDGNALEARVTTAETSIIQNADAILLKASQSDLDLLEGRMTSAESELTVAGNRISAVVTSNVDEEGNYIIDGQNIVSAINLTGSGITISASKINLEGVIMLSSLGDDFEGVFSVENNRTVIDGGVLQTGSVKASSIDLKELSVTREETDGSTTTTLYISEDGSINMIGSLRSINYSDLSGWKIDEDGTAILNQAIVRGSLLLDNAGMTDDVSGSDAVRIWAGTDYDYRDNAKFRVLQDGRLFATDGHFEGTFTGSLELGDIRITDDTPGEPGLAEIMFVHGIDDIPIKISSEITYFDTQFIVGSNANKRFWIDSNEILMKGSRVRISQVDNDVDYAKDIVFPNSGSEKLVIWDKGAYSFDVVDDGFVFGSNRYPSGPDFIFKNEGGTSDVTVQIQGIADITSEILMGNMKIIRRIESGNTGIDFVF